METLAPDQQQAIEYLQTFPTEILAAAARGQIDLNRLAHKELSYRGASAETGQWIGFKAAAEEYAKR